jgi:hypothetical protein
MKKTYIFREPLFLLTHFMGVVIGLFAPDDVLIRFPWIKAISSPLSEAFPPIRFYSENSRFPQVTELYCSFMWIVAPLHYYWCGKDLSLSKQGQSGLTHLDKMPIGDRIATAIAHVIFFFGMPVVIYFYWFLNNGIEFAWFPVHKSRFALAFGGLIYAGTLGWMMLRVEVLILEKLMTFVRAMISKER